MVEEPSRQGWEPNISGDLTLARVVDEAFHYRGDVTVVKNDGASLVGFVSNRNAKAAQPFLQIVLRTKDEPLTILYRDVATIRFTGRDTAAGQSYEAWKKRREQGNI